jgi:hypothetical protein
VTLLLQGADEVTANETASAGDDDKIILGHQFASLELIRTTHMACSDKMCVDDGE